MHEDYVLKVKAQVSLSQENKTTSAILEIKKEDVGLCCQNKTINSSNKTINNNHSRQSPDNYEHMSSIAEYADLEKET